MTCSIDGCDRTHTARGLCNAHYQRWRTHGDPLAGGPPLGLVRREFDRLVQLETDECIIWPFSVSGRGYGQVSVGQGLQRYTHVLALEMRVGPRPDGHEAAHGPCNNTRCMNYRHLRWATPVENNADKRRDGTLMRGEACHQAKLDRHKVREIRRLLGTVPQSRIAHRYGVTQSQISAIATGRQWGWVE